MEVVSRIFKANPAPCHNDIVRGFLANGYGVKRAEYWIKQFVRLGIICLSADNKYRIPKEYAA